MIKYNESKIIKMDKGSVVGIVLGMVMIMRNVIFDIGSVLVEFDPERFFVSGLRMSIWRKCVR